jgi:hypothetical protein
MADEGGSRLKVSRKTFLKLGAMAGAGLALPLGTLSIHLLPPNPSFEGCLSPAFRYVYY